MLRRLNWLLVLATLASAFVLYAIKYDTRRLEARVQAQERALEKAENDVTILMAERTHLARPERLEPLARLIGLAPVSPSQYLRVDLSARRDAPSSLLGDGQAGGDSKTSAAELPPTPNPSSHRVEDAPPARWGGEVRKR